MHPVCMLCGEEALPNHNVCAKCLEETVEQDVETLDLSSDELGRLVDEIAGAVGDYIRETAP